MNSLITQYPVTQARLRHLTEVVGAPLTTIVVSTITARGYGEVFRYFRGQTADAVYVPVIDTAGWPLVAPLQVLSMLMRTRRRFVIEPELNLRPYGLADALGALVRIMLGALHGLYTVAREWLRLRRLLRAKRIVGARATRKSVAYLKTNLWLGIQAGGSVAHTSGVVKGLLNKGYDVDFISVETPIAMPPESDALRFRHVTPRSAYVVPREVNHFRHNQPFIDHAMPLLQGEKGFIYQRLSLGNSAGVVLSRRSGWPLVLEYNGSENWLASNWGTPLMLAGLVDMAERACLRHAHLVVTVSDVLRDELVRRGVDPERIVTHANGVDTAAFDPDNFSARDRAQLRERYGIASDALVITFVGTFGPWHGAEVLARCVAEMAKAEPDFLTGHKIHFLFIGDGVRRHGVEQLMADPSIQRFVTVAGLIDQEETPLHLAASDVLVSPHVANPDGSPFFGSPTKLFEYLASGRPVIGSDLNQIADVLEGCPHVAELATAERKAMQGACGLRVTPEDSDDLTTAIRFAVEHPDWRKAAGLNARRRALERYGWDRHVEAILDGQDRVDALEPDAKVRPVRLLFNGLHSKSGGGLTYLRNMLPYLARSSGMDVHLCIHRDQEADLPPIDGTLTVHSLDFPEGFWRLQASEQIEVPRLARRIGADVTFSPANFGPILAPNAVILLRNALSVAFVERRPIKLAYWALVYLATVLSMLTARQVITVSEYARRAASGGLIGFFSDRLSVVPHGVADSFTPPEKGRPREDFLLAVSDIYVQKNLKNLIGAVALLRRDHPDLVLEIAGRPLDPQYFDELKELIGQAGIEGAVVFLGGVAPEELVGLYRRCRVFVFPSTVETFGNPLVEAMACGAPIASSNSAAMPEVLGDAAVYFDPADREDIRAAIDRLLRDTELRRDMSERAIARAKDFSWQRTAEKTLAVIREAANAE